MSTYFPYLRGKQNELLALKLLALTIAKSHAVVPIVEPVNGNATTTGALEKFVDEGMSFLFVTNPKHGDYKGREQQLFDDLVTSGSLAEYDNYIPALHINRGTRMQEVDDFNEKYEAPFRAVIYNAEPTSSKVRDWCAQENRIYHHVFLDGKVSQGFIQGIPTARRVMIRDNFTRQSRNSDYPTEVEHFTDKNTEVGNPENINWGDYSIVGDQYTEGGGAALAVAIHHIHKSESTGALQISHFLSDHQETTANVSGKVIEAVQNLVNNLDGLVPNETCACNIYKDIAETRNSRGLGYLKRLSILHHLETILADD
jgi:hypothetical protein